MKANSVAVFANTDRYIVILPLYARLSCKVTVLGFQAFQLDVS